MLQDDIARMEGIGIDDDVELTDRAPHAAKLGLCQGARAVDILAGVVIVQAPRVEVAHVPSEAFLDGGVVVAHLAQEQEHGHDTVWWVACTREDPMIGQTFREQLHGVRIQEDVGREHAARVRHLRETPADVDHGEHGRKVALVQRAAGLNGPVDHDGLDERAGRLGRLVVNQRAATIGAEGPGRVVRLRECRHGRDHTLSVSGEYAGPYFGQCEHQHQDQKDGQGCD